MSQTRLAYVVTGNADVDSIVKAGLSGLTLFLAQRTALEAGDPVGVDPAHDELAFFPLIYWPIVPGAPKPPQDALNRIDAYMKQGGTVMFDTRDAVEAPPGDNGASQTPGMQALRDILSSLDVPELEPVPREHVLTKTFYLLRDFPGRFTTGQTWVEALPREDEDESAREAPGARRRRRLADHHHLERSRRRLGDPSRRPADAAADAGRAEAARIRLPRRRQHRDVHADRQLQGRPGACAGADRTAGAIGSRHELRHRVHAAGSLARALDRDRGDRRHRGSAAARRSRGAAVRVAALALIVLALANPSFTREDREPLTSVVAVVVDKSPSQNFGKRNQETAQAQEALVDSLKKIKGLEVRVVDAGQADGETDGTHLFGALSSALSDVPVDRVAGAFLITDGRVHDIPANAAAVGFQAPVHALITGHKDERDRRIAISAAPRFGIVGQTQTITYRLDDQGVTGERAKVTIRRDGEMISERTLQSGQTSSVDIDIKHAGPNIVEIEASPLENELTLVNNRAVVAIDGVRDKLRVLLVSGEPHSGERTWRNLLKSDASVDLVHFTILRPPEKQDGTPINELSLIAFPTRELFQQKINEFQLIIFDRYARQGVLPIAYFDNIARYVRAGGAVLVSAGPDYASTTSIWRTPLDSVLPAEPVGVTEKPFYAHLSDAGKRHPVTRGLEGSASEPPHWSRFFRTVDTRNAVNPPVMTGADGKPLLLLSRFGEGRVALLLSDHIWLWARGYEGGGPHLDLLTADVALADEAAGPRRGSAAAAGAGQGSRRWCARPWRTASRR